MSVEIEQISLRSSPKSHWHFLKGSPPHYVVHEMRRSPRPVCPVLPHLSARMIFPITPRVGGYLRISERWPACGEPAVADLNR